MTESVDAVRDFSLSPPTGGILEIDGKVLRAVTRIEMVAEWSPHRRFEVTVTRHAIPQRLSPDGHEVVTETHTVTPKSLLIALGPEAMRVIKGK